MVDLSLKISFDFAQQTSEETTLTDGNRKKENSFN
jgi:hypothetical protein